VTGVGVGDGALASSSARTGRFGAAGVLGAAAAVPASNATPSATPTITGRHRRVGRAEPGLIARTIW
jgi:hypothetical protein